MARDVLHLEKILPRTCNAMAHQLDAWLDVGSKERQESVILNQDGSMNDELFALITLAYAYFARADSSSESWQNLCLLEARRAFIESVRELRGVR